MYFPGNIQGLPEDNLADHFVTATAEDLMVAHAQNLQYPDHYSREMDGPTLCLQTVFAMIYSPIGIAMLTSAYFMTKSMQCEILSMRMLHRGFREVFSLYPKDFMGLFARQPFLTALLELTFFGERGGACHAIHAPDPEFGSQQHDDDHTNPDAILVPCRKVQPQNLGPYQDHLENRYCEAWKGIKQTRYHELKRYGSVMYQNSDFAIHFDRLNTVYSMRIRFQQSIRVDFQEDYLHCLGKPELQQLLEHSQLIGHVKATLDQQYLNS